MAIVASGSGAGEESLALGIEPKAGGYLKGLDDPSMRVRSNTCVILCLQKGVDDKTLGKLAQMLEGDQSLPVRCAAAQAVGALAKGTNCRGNCVGALEQALTHQDPGLRAAAATALGQLQVAGCADQLADLLREPHVPLRRAALRALGEVGAVQYLPQVLEALEQPLLRAAAITALGRFGEESAPLAERVAGFVEEADGSVRFAAVECLGAMSPRLGSRGADIASRVAKLLHRPDGRLRATAATALGRLGPVHAGAYVGQIATLLNDRFAPEIVSDVPSEVIRPACAAAYSLGLFGQSAAAWVPALFTLARLPADECRRVAAVRGLGHLAAQGVLQEKHLNAIASLRNDSCEAVAFTGRAIEVRSAVACN